MADETTPSAPLSAGSTAPDFSLTARSGKTISLRDFRGSKDVLIYFYPKDDTPGCTRESCSLRDGWADLQKAGIEILGISRDDSASHNAFASKYNLPFELLTDTDHAVHEAYGSWGPNPNPAWGVGPLRKSFLVGKDGRIRRVFDKVDTEHHAEQVLRAAGFTPAPRPAPAPIAAPAAAPAPKPASPPAPVMPKPPAPPAPVMPKPAAPAAPVAAAPAPRPAAPPAPKPVAPPAPKAPVAKKVVKKAVKKVKKAAKKVKKAVKKVKKAAKRKAAPKKRTAKRTARRSVKKAVAKVKKKVKSAARKRVVRRAVRKTVRKVKRAVRKSKKATKRKKR